MGNELRALWACCQSHIPQGTRLCSETEGTRSEGDGTAVYPLPSELCHFLNLVQMGQNHTPLPDRDKAITPLNDKLKIKGNKTKTYIPGQS